MLHNTMILFGKIERIKSFPSRHYSFVEFRSVNEARRGCYSQQSNWSELEKAISFSTGDAPFVQDTNPNNLIGPNWRRPSSSAPGMLPSPASGIRPPISPLPGAWDVFDGNHFQREPKRSRIDGSLPIDDISFPLRKSDDRVFGMDQSYGIGPRIDGGAPGLLANVQGKNRFSPVDARAMTGGLSQDRSNDDFIWRGVIAKG